MPARFERELGWIPAHTFEQGIRETVQWYLTNQDWVKTVGAAPAASLAKA